LATLTYSASQVIIIVNGVPMTGYADGDFCKVEYTADPFKMYIGADGSTARSRNADHSGSIEITLMQTSPSNDILSAQAEADWLLGIGVGSAMVKDLKGSAIWSAMECWVRKPSPTAYGKEITTRTWVLDVPYLVGHIGGDAN
jgi:hypothetical protein